MVAHAHHIYPLAWQFRDKRNWDETDAEIVPDHDHIWLCPTHHALVNKELADFRQRNSVAPMRVPLDEYKKIAEISLACARKMENAS